MWKRIIKNNYKIFLFSVVLWFALLLIWEYLEKNYQIPSKYLSQFSPEFVLTSGLGLVTTVLTSIYNYQKNKTKQNLEEIRKNRQLSEANKEASLQATRRLEDLIDQQIFELRRLDDFDSDLTEIKKGFGLIEERITSLNLILERQNEHIKQNDKLISFTNFLLEDIKQREILKLQIENIINKLESKKSE